MRRLAIFAGGFTLQAAGAVAADAVHPESEIIDQIAQLVGKSLIAAEVGDAEIDDVDDIRVVELAQHLGFAQKPGHVEILEHAVATVNLDRLVCSFHRKPGSCCICGTPSSFHSGSAATSDRRKRRSSAVRPCWSGHPQLPQSGLGLGVAVGYFHTQWGNMSVTQNVATLPSDYTEYCVTAPTDPRLGAFSGDRVCGFYDVNPNKFGQVDRVVTLAKNFGDPKDYYDGVDVGLTARWGKGALINGGVSVGRETFDVCYTNGRPDLTPQNAPGGGGFTGCAQQLINKVFEVCDRKWRGVGLIPKSGYKLQYDFRDYDAERLFEVEEMDTQESSLCISGLVLRGVKKPHECPAFGKECTPEHPLGATMVSSEGACAAYYAYRRHGVGVRT